MLASLSCDWLILVGGGQDLIGARREPVGDNEFRKLTVSERQEILAV